MQRKRKTMTGAERKRKYRKRRKNDGVCLECGKPSNGKTLCAIHMALQSSRNKRATAERQLALLDKRIENYKNLQREIQLGIDAAYAQKNKIKESR